MGGCFALAIGPKATMHCHSRCHALYPRWCRAMADVDSSERKMCKWTLEPPSIPQWNVDYPRRTFYLDIVHLHGRFCGTQIKRWTLVDALRWQLD